MVAEPELSVILDVTELMYVAAIESAWEELDVLQQRQAAMINAFSMESVSVGERAKLQNIVDLTNQIVELAKAHKEALRKEMVQLKQNGSAQNAYLQNSE